MKIIVAMSGGVDSSVVAHLLKEQGHEVIGLSFELWDKRDLKASNVCCSVETIELARNVAASLGIRHCTVDVRDSFYRHVIESFCNSYIQGLTPNPCILCNKYIKFDELLKKAAELNADGIATGHYARITEGPLTGDRKTYVLRKGADPVKDQSYVLYVLKQEELAKTLFPLGAMKKEETREIARKIGLASAMRPESQEICFVGDDRYADFIRDFSPESVVPGDIIDSGGTLRGRHRGLAFYTIGQRKGLGLASPAPLYVTGIDRKGNRIVVGGREEALKKSFNVKELNWIYPSPLTVPARVHVKIRSTMQEVPATVSPGTDGGVTVAFDDPQWAPAPGQSAVFYDKDLVMGGGIIE
jgi:tRNA-specific 2-thiouridylase